MKYAICPLKAFFVLFALLSLVALPANAEQESEIYIQNLDSLKATGDFLLIPQERRVQILEEMKTAILEKYALIDFKKERVKLDAEAHMNSCIEVERAESVNNNLGFFNRTQKCIAAFKDTHFKTKHQYPMPYVDTGIALTEIDGKFYIRGYYDDIISYVRDRTEIGDLLDIIKPGNEVIEINGESPSKVADRLEPYMAGSSQEFIRWMAVRYITFRNFLYPNKPFMTIKVKVPTGREIEDEDGNASPEVEVRELRIPWFAEREVSRPDASLHFRNVGIPSLHLVRLRYDDFDIGWKRENEEDSTQKFKGFSMMNPLVDISLLETYYLWDEDENKPKFRSVMRTGEVIRNKDQVFCYLQLNSFGSYLVHQDGETTMNITDIAGEFIKGCEEKSLPLLFDLRQNGGGHSPLPAMFLSILTEKDTTYMGRFYASRVSPHSAWQDISRVNIDDLPSYERSDFSDFDGDIAIHRAEEMMRAIENGKDYTRIVTAMPVKADENVGGFSGKVVALVTSRCISACDNMSNLLKKSGRATIVGSHSNGTGAGFTGNNMHEFTYYDSFSGIKMRIPNYLFGVLDIFSEETFFDFDAYRHTVSENLPTVADILYSTTLRDLQEDGAGWVDKAMDALFAKGKKSGAAAKNWNPIPRI